MAFGVENEVDLVLQNIAGQKNYTQEDFNKAKSQYDRNLQKFSQDSGDLKNQAKKEERFLTIQSLLDHPYFININTADISSVIDQYEVL